MVAISYDPADKLAAFAEEKGIDFPLLADPESEVIKRYGVHDDKYAHPGTFLIDKTGVVRHAFFEDGYKKRHSVESLLEANALLKESASALPASAFEVAAGTSMGPISLGMSKAKVDALGLLRPHPQYSAMTLPYTVYYKDGLVSSVELSLMHASHDIKVGELTVPKNSTAEAVIKLLGDCEKTEHAIGGSSTRCREGGLAVSVGSGNQKEVWLRLWPRAAKTP